MEKILEGIRVIDFTGYAAGPSCTQFLREYGAEVIWIEPIAGSTSRFSAPHMFDFYMAGKKSVALNLKTTKGKEVMYRLIEGADVFVHNFRDRAINKLGLDYETLRSINPRIIWAGLYGYGLNGPAKDLPGYDTVSFWARSGMLADLAEKGQVMVPPLAIGDCAAGQGLAGAICGALYRREKNGKGMKLYTSLYAEALYLNHETIVESQYGTEYPQSRLSPMRSMLNTYKCSDGKWITMLISTNFEKNFNNLLRAINREDLIGDPRWTCIEDTMYENAPEFVAILDEAIGKMTRPEIIAALDKYDIACGEISSAMDCIKDPQAIENQYVFPWVGSDGKDLTLVTSPVKFMNDEPAEFSNGPKLGADTMDVLSGIGYTKDEIISMSRNSEIALEQ